jgi:hypothetical protein
MEQVPWFVSDDSGGLCPGRLDHHQGGLELQQVNAIESLK